MLKKRGQTWSFDLIIAVILFIVVVAVFYAFLARDSSSTGAKEQQDFAKSISTQLVCDATSSDNNCFIKDGAIDEANLISFADTSYDLLRKDLGVQGDFCVYMVLVDNDGIERIVPFRTNSRNLSGVGSGDFDLSDGVACGETI